MKITKKRALEFFGGTIERTATACKMTASGVKSWGDPLPLSAVALVILRGLAEKGLKATRTAFPEAFPKP